MKTLHLCTSDSWGGLEMYACGLMDALRSSGCEVAAICKPNSKIEEFLSARNIRFTYLPSYSPASLASVRFLKSLLREHDVDVVHVHFHRDIWPASFALRRDRRRKLFLSVYMGAADKNDFWHRYIYKRVNGVFSSSTGLNARLAELYPIPKEKIHFLPYGRHLEAYAPDEDKRRAIRSALGVGSGEMVVGVMVRIDPGKGVMDFAESFLYLGKELQEKTRFMIVGEPTRKGNVKPGESPFESHCEEYLRQLQTFVTEHHLENKIHLVGFQRNVVGYLSAMDVFVFPSRDELYSIAVLEAMCLCLPIVAARAGGNMEQIDDGVNGLFYDVADSRDLARKLSSYLNDPGLRKKHGVAGRAFVEENHDMKKTVNRLVEFYTST
ncbi:MAG: glycosyltransferase family 4 protein [Bacteroidota bacterium]